MRCWEHHGLEPLPSPPTGRDIKRCGECKDDFDMPIHYKAARAVGPASKAAGKGGAKLVGRAIKKMLS